MSYDVTRFERRELRRNIAEMRAQSRFHPGWYARQEAARALAMLERVELEDPRPGFWLRWRLRLAGVDAG